jgi:hypothetical protein
MRIVEDNLAEVEAMQQIYAMSSPVPVSDAATMVSSSTWMTAMMMVTVMVMMMVVVMVVVMMMETLRTTPWSSIGYFNCHY